MSTRAINYLQKSGRPFEIVTYDPVRKGARYAAQAIGYALERTLKTLVAELDGGRYVLVLVPGHQQLDLKALARYCRSKRASMAAKKTAERLTGYRIGGISPFGTTQPLPVVMEKRVLSSARVLINAGRRGTMLKMAPLDILDALSGEAACIAKE